MNGMRRGPKVRGLAIPDLVMARLESGLPLKDALMPGASYEGWHSHCKLFPEWAVKAKALAARNAEPGKLRRLEKMGVLRKRAMTHCKRGHELSGDNIYWFRGGKQRKCRACSLLNNANPLPATEDQIRRVTDAINAGKRANQFCGRRTPERILGYNKLQLLRQTNPEFDQLYRSKILVRRSLILRPTAPKEIVLTPERIEFNQIANLVPRYLPHDVRDDVIQMIFLAIAEGTLQRDQVPAGVRDFISAHYREARPHSVGKYGLRSLDAPVYADSSMTLADKVNRVIWDEVPM